LIWFTGRQAGRKKMVGTYLPTYPPFGWMNSGWTGLVTFGWILVGHLWMNFGLDWLGHLWMNEFWLDWFGHLWMNPGWTGLVTCEWILVGLVGHLWMNFGWTGLVTCGWNSGWTGLVACGRILVGLVGHSYGWSFWGFIHPQLNGVCSVARFIHWVC
jgi:hypothetical protein